MDHRQFMEKKELHLKLTCSYGAPRVSLIKKNCNKAYRLIDFHIHLLNFYQNIK